MASSKEYCIELLNRAGIQINGSHPWDMQVHDDSIFDQVLSRGNLGLGETYMAGLWDAERLDQFFHRLLRSGVQDEVNPARLIFHSLKSRLFNLQDDKRAWEVGQKHYDIGNKLYQAMLDERMVYTCGYWRDADNLDDAQRDKLELSCQKLQLKPGMKILDIGCGWGSFMQYAAEHYGVECVGVTISKEQVRLGEERCKGLPVEFRLQDYRDLDESFDRIISLGMFEHVGQKNYEDYMDVARRCLKDDGLFLLHTIGKNVSDTAADPWISRYIFPNGEIPSIAQIGAALEERFVCEDLHNFGADYDKTLMGWFENFDTAWPQLQGDYEKTFYRMWKYYLLSCAGAFRARDIQLWQWVLSKQGIEGGYHRPFV
ncbi:MULTISPECIES: cyclopropane fatty acyl phospholipid synthase [unclassified Idiomarina]|uniref:cyclopropane fatty acyl phospholipid synthase n=1 Tax=unclassified Idiomarina TaxID=2614829 RepID=UPI000C89E371|nr:MULTISPECIES: cyclopropane fatty acyl phospholipid synthase [unclassified Idiomarina]MAD54235.1 cyclopropane-fatty-acyl-phospholipid synthase [Idiomarinaceae bacterium]NQZ05391.1 cyclopropane fatty acyl phospholipid synthase [Idiomarina sp.]|tara:strand:+ start:313 stop:1428 length:1116 start_codon:yes stop_codon:yes gene_type:complete